MSDHKIGKIVIPENKERLAGFIKGKIVAIGPSAFRYLDKKEINFKVGSKVIVVKNAGISLNEAGLDADLYEEKRYKLVNDEDIRLVWKS